MNRANLAAAGLVLTLAAGAGAWYARAAPEPPPVAVLPSRAGDGVATVHVSGAVAVPGLVEVAEGSRVADAIAAAGGALPGAELGALNLAAAVGDGQQLVVPAAGPGGAAFDGAAESKVRVNSAAASELERLPGVGPVLAERIVEHRSTHGPFSTVEDLLDVPGIGEGKLAALREAVQVP